MSRVFGIDLGTTYSCIAYIDEYGKPVVLKNSDGDRTTPVSYTHLDVYKRQDLDSAKRRLVLVPGGPEDDCAVLSSGRILLWRPKDCLLYTSEI